MDIAQLFNPVEKITGLEISQGYLRATFLEQTKKGGLRVAHAEVPLPQGVIVNGIPVNKEALIQALKSFQQNNRGVFRSKYVIVAIPAAQTHMDVMKFPPLGPDQIEESIRLNLNTKTIFPMEEQEIYFDWQSAPSKDSYHREILLGLAPRKTVQDYLALCEEAGLEPLAFETPPFSLSRALENFKDKTGLLIRVLSEGVECSVISGTDLRFCRFAPMPQMENMEAFKTFLKEEAYRVMSFYMMENPHEGAITPIVLLAYFDQKKDIADHLAKELSLSVENAHFTGGVQVGDADAAAYGAGLRGLIKRDDDTLISLMPIGTEETYRKRRFLSYVSLWSDIVTATAVLLVAVFGATWFFLDMTSKKAAEQLSRSSAHSAMTDQIDALEAQASAFNATVASIAGVEQSIFPWSSLISKIIPALRHDKITLTNVNMPSPDGAIRISIVAENRDAAISFRKALLANALFATVQVPPLGINDRGNITQTITITVKPTTP